MTRALVCKFQLGRPSETGPRTREGDRGREDGAKSSHSQRVSQSAETCWLLAARCEGIAEAKVSILSKAVGSAPAPFARL